MGLFRRSEEERQLRSFYRPWYRRPVIWVAMVLPLLLLARLALTPLAWYQVRKHLAALPEYDITFSSLSLALMSNQVIFRDVKVHHRSEANRHDTRALATIPFVQMDLPLRKLLQGGPVDRVTLIEPIFRPRTDSHLALSAQARTAWLQAATRLPLREIKILRIERGMVLAAEQAKAALTGSDRALVRDLDVSVTGLRFGSQTSADVLQARINGGLMLGSGILKGDLQLTPDGERSWDFKGEIHLAGLDLQDLRGHALAPALPTGPAPQGKFRLKAAFEVKRGQLSAHVEPQMHINSGSVFSQDNIAALQAKTTRTTGMVVWEQENQLHAGLPATMVPLRIIAVVQTLVMQSAAAALTASAPPSPIAEVTADAQPI